MTLKNQLSLRSQGECRCHSEPDPPVRARCKLCGRVAGPEPKHVCHADGCSAVVPPKMLFCLKHWRMTPKDLQRRIWDTYVPGQEVRKNPTGEYMEAQRAAVDAVARKEGRR